MVPAKLFCGDGGNARLGHATLALVGVSGCCRLLGEEGLWIYLVRAANDMFDKRGMTSEGFHGSGHCTHL